MYILDPKEMQEVDRYTIDHLGISEQTLMNNAAKAVFEEIKRIKAAKISTIVGKGNNGADTLILSKMLIEDGYKVIVFLLPEFSEFTETSKKLILLLEQQKDHIFYYNESSDISADIIVDGIFGTGFKGKLSEKYRKVIQKINRSNALTVSVDIPSGLNGRTGEADGLCVMADMTVSFGAAKTGFFQGIGTRAIGQLEVKNIGFPEGAFSQVSNNKTYIDKDFVKKLLPSRKASANKGDFGKTLIIAGSRKMPGAGILCCKAAYRTGSGYVFSLTERVNRKLYASSMPEVIQAYDLDPNKYSSIAIGPGLGVDRKTIKFIRTALECEKSNVILDADALNSIQDLSILKRAKNRIILTPHPKEMSRLIGISVEEVLENRINICREFSKEYKVITLLKGRNTVIADENGGIYVNSTGNDALAKAGSGDVLTGMVAGFSAYIDLLDAAVLSVYLHGACADQYVVNKSSISMLASEIIDFLPNTIFDLK